MVLQMCVKSPSGLIFNSKTVVQTSNEQHLSSETKLKRRDKYELQLHKQKLTEHSSPWFSPQPPGPASSSWLLMAGLLKRAVSSPSNELGTKLPRLRLQDYPDHEHVLSTNILGYNGFSPYFSDIFFQRQILMINQTSYQTCLLEHLQHYLIAKENKN